MIAEDDVATTIVGASDIVIDVLANDVASSPDHFLFVTAITSPPDFGKCTFSNDRNSVLYQAPTDIASTGSVACGYKACTFDSDGNEDACDIAFVFIDIVATGVMAFDDEVFAIVGANDIPIDVLDNDFTSPKRPLIISSVSQDLIVRPPAEFGSCSINNAKTMIMYRPPTDPDTGGNVAECGYEICTNDGRVRSCDTAIVMIHIMSSGVMAIDDHAFAMVKGRNAIIPVLANDFASPLEALIITEITSDPEFGTCFRNPDDTMIMYSPPTNLDLVGKSVTCGYKMCIENKEDDDVFGSSSSSKSSRDDMA